MLFIWRTFLTLLIIFLIGLGGWMSFLASPLIVMLLSSYRNDIVRELITLDRRSINRTLDLTRLIKNKTGNKSDR